MGTVRFEREGAIAWIVLDNPAKHNAVDSGMSKQIAEAWVEIDRDDDIRVAIVTGEGKSFCSGGEMGSYVAGGVLGEGGSGLPSGIPKPDRLAKPIIAAVAGHCLAGGFGLALACDLRIVATNLNMGPTGLKRGVIPGGQQIERLVKLVPFGKALEILLMAKNLGAEEALAIGLVQKVVPPEALRDTAREWAQAIARFSPRAVRDTKKLAYECMPMEWHASFALGAGRMRESFATEDGKEGFLAFLEKREPNFSGR